MKIQKALLPEQQTEIIEILKNRFEKNKTRHTGLEWSNVHSKLIAPFSQEKLWSLNEMERTGGEPDVVGYDNHTDEFIFFDCSVETPKERRSICYDKAALEARKEFKPENNAVEMATKMGIQILTETEYRTLQKLGNFDLKTSSWIKTPDEIRKLGGALFCDRRYNQVFVYHNGAQSYYSSRGFRGSLRV